MNTLISNVIQLTWEIIKFAIKRIPQAIRLSHAAPHFSSIRTNQGYPSINLSLPASPTLLGPFRPFMLITGLNIVCDAPIKENIERNVHYINQNKVVKELRIFFSWIRVYGHLKRKGFPSSRSEFQFSSQQADVVVTKEVIMMQIERFLLSKLSFHRHRRRPFHKWKCFVESSTSRGSLGECSSRGQVLDIVWKRAETLKLGINILDGDEWRFRREAHWGNYRGNIFFIFCLYSNHPTIFHSPKREPRAASKKY